MGTARWLLGDLVSHTTWRDWPDPDRRPSVTSVGAASRLGQVTQLPAVRREGRREGRGRPEGRTPRSLSTGTRLGDLAPLSSAGPHPGQARRGTHLTEPRRLPFSFSWLRLGRCTPVGHSGHRSEATSRHLQRHRCPRRPLPVAALRPSRIAPVCGQVQAKMQGRAGRGTEGVPESTRPHRRPPDPRSRLPEPGSCLQPLPWTPGTPRAQKPFSQHHCLTQSPGKGI